MRNSRIYPLLLRSWEVVQTGGVRATGFEPRRPGGAGRADAAVDYDTAMRLIRPFMALPPSWREPVRCLALGGVHDIHRWAKRLEQLVESRIVHPRPDWVLFGVEYGVWWWLEREARLPVPKGARRNCREFGDLVGISHESARQWWHANVAGVLDGWCAAAEGELEPLCNKLFPIGIALDMPA